MKYAVVSVDSGMEESFPLEGFQMISSKLRQGPPVIHPESQGVVFL